MTGRVLVDLSEETDSLDGDRRDRHRLMELEQCPDGATVTVLIGSRRYFGGGVTRLLAKHGERLHIEVVGQDVSTVWALITDARGGSPWDEPSVPVPTRLAS